MAYRGMRWWLFVECGGSQEDVSPHMRRLSEEENEVAHRRRLSEEEDVVAHVKRCFIFTHYYSHNVYSKKQI
jgi:hypothetical protein